MDACVMRDRLMQQWKAAAQLYAELSATSVQHLGRIPKADYDNLRNSVVHVGKITEKLRSDLELHIQLHACGKVESRTLNS